VAEAEGVRSEDKRIVQVFRGIVNVRPNTVGNLTDAYFAVEEIKDVCLIHSC
jgi:hypothetical protein